VTRSIIGTGIKVHTIAFITQKGGAGKTTLAASLAVAAAAAGEKVIALDFDRQASLVGWGKRRATAAAPNGVIVEPFEIERLTRLTAIIEGLAEAGFTIAIFDTAGADSTGVRLLAEAVDFCLLPARPTRLDVEATATTFRAAYLAKRKAAFVLNQCPPSYRSLRASAAAKELSRLGVLAEPMLSARIDFQDAIAAGLGVTEYARDGRAAQEIESLWRWVRAELQRCQGETPVPDPCGPRLTALTAIMRTSEPRLNGAPKVD
jgi:chromosome partitioning protein